MSTAFDPIALGDQKLGNRIVMSPMTRSRAYGADNSPTDDVATYYAQRARAGLIITEGIQPSVIGQGYPATPGLHSAAQVQSWRNVTDAVHAAGGTIFAQLMHTGRIGHPSTYAEPRTPVGPSAVRAAGQIFTTAGPRDFVVPRELSSTEVAQTIADFVAAARNAIAAGFDGVEVHGANGYLLHQFLSTNANQRRDRWGGAPENRVRFTSEVVRAVADAIGPGRTGLRISPNNGLGDTLEADYATTYRILLTELDQLGLAYLHLVEAGDPELTSVIRAEWSAPLILNAATADPLDHPNRLDLVAEGTTDMVSFGRLFIANPDLVSRLTAGAELALPEMSMAYGGDHRGYTDYPTMTGAVPIS